MECAGVQHDSVANVKPRCAYLPEIGSNNFINKVSGSGDMLPPQEFRSSQIASDAVWDKIVD